MRGARAFRLCLLVASLGLARVALAAEPTSLDRYAGLSPDSTDARKAVISEDVKGFRIAFDAALASAPKRDPRWTSLFPQAAGDYWHATGDSLLMADVKFAEKAGASAIEKWHEATGWDETGSALQNADPAKAAPLLRRAAETYRDVRHLRREAVAWGSLGVACWNEGNLDCVETAYRRALITRRQLGDSLLIGRTLNGMGSLHFRRGEYDSALVYYQDAKAVRERLGRKADLGTTVAYIGNVYYRLGDLGAARRHYVDALDYLGPNGPQKPVSDARAGLANVLSELGDYREASRIYREEAEAAEARGDSRWGAVLRGNLGLELSRMGEHGEALKQLDAARDTLAAVPDTFELARVVNTIGLIYLDMTDYARALKELEEAQRLATASENHPVLGSSLLDLGTTYLEMGLLERSQSSFDRALKQYEALKDSLGMNQAYLKLALVKAKGGQYDEALDLHRRILAWNEAHGLLSHVAYAHANIASVLDERGKGAEARQEYHKGADLARQLGRNDVLWRCYLGIGNTFESSGTLDSARVYNQRAIDVLESLRGRNFSEETKAAFLGKWSYVYEAQIHVLAKLQRRHPNASWIEEAWTTAERGKARAFLDALAAGNVDFQANLDPTTRARKQELDLEVNDLRHRLREARSSVSADTLTAWKDALRNAETRLAQIEERSRRDNPRLATLGAERPLTLADMRRRLLTEDGSLLLEYSLGDSASYVFAITGKESRLFPLAPRSEIENQVRQLRSVLSSPAPAGDAQFIESAMQLYRMVLAPVSDRLKEARSVIIVPDGLLHILPFDVLFEKAPAEIPAEAAKRGEFFAKLPYAFGSRRMSYGPSASALALMASQSASGGKTRRLFALGDPEFSPANAPEDSAGQLESKSVDQLRPLPQSRVEVEAIAKRFRPEDRWLLLGREARELTVTAADALDQYRIIHFATHGLVDQRHPERSSLALAYPQDPQEDGFLQASEIYRLHLNADLVVLSACETGLGRMVRGEGVLGLPRAFFYAGARSVLVSLWSVSDASTAELMTRLYGSLVEKGESTSRALAEAKASLRNDTDVSHPFYWAPFVLIGPPEGATSKTDAHRSH